MTNRKRKLRRAARNTVTQLKWAMWVSAEAERLKWAYTRDDRVAKRSLMALTRELLEKYGKLCIDDLYDEHKKSSNISIKAAIAEVDTFHAKNMQRLRDEGMLIYPVTLDGWNGTYGTDIARAIPGRGRGQAVYGWVVATGPDPLFESYWGMRLGPVRGGLTKVIDTSERAAIAGVIPKAISRDVLKELPSEIN